MGATGVIGLERFDMVRGQVFTKHVHDDHQLAWASSGVLMVEVDTRCWVLPPNLALWIPAGTWHATVALRETAMEGVYLDPAGVEARWGDPTVLSVSPLARHLIKHLAGELGAEERVRAEAVLLDVLVPVARSTIELPMPVDQRARRVADSLLADPADRRDLDAFAREVGSSPRTLLRVFLGETGMTFAQWRTHARMQAAIGVLAEGVPVGRVAERVGYATPSAFVAAFRRVTGHTPTGYFGALGDPAGGVSTTS